MHFIVFEGLDGSGKSTLMKRLEAQLRSRSVTSVLTREPGGTELGDEVRSMLLRTKGQAPCPRTELLLYEASRAQHTDLVIKPALARGDWVLCDRYSASSVAFQAGGRQISEPDVHWLNNFATAGLTADLTVLVDLSFDECLKRQSQREQEEGQEKDRMESEARDFHERVRESFLQQARAGKDTWLVLEGSLSPDALEKKLLQTLKEKNWL